MKHTTIPASAEPACATPGYREVRAEEGKLRDALAASQRRLDAAVARIERLLANDRLHADKVAALARAAEKAQQLAYRDELTGLPNRRLLKERFDQAVALAARNRQKVALLFLDIDGFKGINDRFGHAAGDSLLQQVAARLTECIRSSDTACRYGGDEFVILLPTIENEHSVTVTAHKIRSILAAHYTVAGTEVEVHASIGTAVYPVHGRAYLELIEASDREMYQNKPAHSSRRLADNCNPLTGSSP
jgi:diguanylate cyclase (GGDEF)-like protein